jgi:cytoskeletal protein RodZ
MDKSKVEKLRELQELLASDIISQDEFDVMKQNILKDDKSEDIARTASAKPQVIGKTKRPHVARNIVLVVLAIIVLGVAGTAVYFNTRPADSSSSENTSKSVSSESKDSSSSMSSSTQSDTSSSSSTSNDQKFTRLTQNEQLALLVAWGADKGGGAAASQINNAETLTADLNQANMITLYPTPGNMGIEVRDNHDGTFDMQVYMDGQVTGSGRMTGNELVEHYYANAIESIVSKLELK